MSKTGWAIFLIVIVFLMILLAIRPLQAAFFGLLGSVFGADIPNALQAFTHWTGTIPFWATFLAYGAIWIGATVCVVHLYRNRPVLIRRAKQPFMTYQSQPAAGSPVTINTTAPPIVTQTATTAQAPATTQAAAQTPQTPQAQTQQQQQQQQAASK
jgi:hypothetical protein